MVLPPASPGHHLNNPNQTTMTIIQAGAQAPEFALDSHQDAKVSSADFAGKKAMMLVFYPLDFTPT